jgi:hypothetical protein
MKGMREGASYCLAMNKIELLLKFPWVPVKREQTEPDSAG